MDDYIKREDALKVFDTDSMIKAWHKTESIPSADVAPVRHGKWIDKSGGIEGAWNYCSVCGEQAIELYDYCPNCGAKMEDDNETD